MVAQLFKKFLHLTEYLTLLTMTHQMVSKTIGRPMLIDGVFFSP